MNNWDIDYDPYGYGSSEAWFQGIKRVEDILRISHVWGDVVLRVGYSEGVFVARVVVNGELARPVAREEVADPKHLTGVIDGFLERFVNHRY